MSILSALKSDDMYDSGNQKCYFAQVFTAYRWHSENLSFLQWTIRACSTRPQFFFPDMVAHHHSAPPGAQAA